MKPLRKLIRDMILEEFNHKEVHDDTSFKTQNRKYGAITRDDRDYKKFETDNLQFIQARQVHWEELFRLAEMITPLTVITNNKKDYPLELVYFNGLDNVYEGDVIHIINKNGKILYTATRGDPEFRIFSRWIFKFFSI